MATTNIINTRLEIEGEEQYRQSLRNADQALQTLRSQLDLVTSEYRDNADSAEALGAKLNVLNSIAQEQRQRVELLSQALSEAQNVQRSYAEGVEDARREVDRTTQALEALEEQAGDTSEEQHRLSEDLRAYQEILRDAERDQQEAANGVLNWQTQMNLAQRDLVDLNAEIRQNQECLEAAGQESRNFGSRTQEALEGLSSVMEKSGLNAGVEKIRDALSECIEISAQFETSMAKIGTISDKTSLPLDGLKEEILTLSGTLGISAGEISDSIYGVISAGVDTADSVSLVEDASKLAAIGFKDTSAAADFLATAMGEYGLKATEVSQVSDYLTTTQNLTKESMEELAGNMKTIIPAAASCGVEMDNLSAGYAALIQNGSQASEASASLKAMLAELSDSGSAVSSILKEKTGKSFSELSKSGKSLGDIMEILGDSVDGNSDKFSALWSSSEAGSGAWSLLNTGAAEYNDTLGQMQDSVGATERVYQDMTNTLEFSQQRASTAFDNLKIAIGDQLTPALKNVTDAGADAFEWATEFVQENPEVVALIASVVGGFTALAAGVAACTAAATLFNAVLSANPIAKTVIVVGTLVGALGSLAAFLSSSSEEAEELAEKNEALKASVDETIAGFEEQRGAISQNKDEQKLMADQLNDLVDMDNKSSAAKKSILDMVNELNSTIPGLSLAYDEETDSLNMTSEAIEKMIEKQKAQEEYALALEEQRDLTIQRQEAAEALEEAQRMLAEAEEEEQESIGGFILGWSEASRNVETLSEGVSSAQQALEAIDEQMVVSQEALNDYALEAAGASETVIGLKNGILEEAAGLSDNLEAYSQVKDALNELNEGYIAYVEEHNAHIENLKEQEESLKTAYNESYQAVYDKLTSEMGLFQSMSSEADQSIGDLIGSLQSQMDFMDEYASNIEKAIDLGVNKGLVEQLSDGSEESAKILAAIVKGGEEEINELNEKFDSVEVGKKSFSSKMAEMKTNFSTEMAAIQNELKNTTDELDQADAMYQAGVNTIEGFINGSEDKRSSIVTTYRNLGNAASQAFKNALKIQSPSKEFAWSGEMTIEGAIGGAKKKETELVQTYHEMAEQALMSYRGKMQDLQEKANQQDANLIPIFPDPLGTYDQKQVPANLGRSGDIVVSITSELDGKKISDAVVKRITGEQNSRRMVKGN